MPKQRYQPEQESQQQQQQQQQHDDEPLYDGPSEYLEDLLDDLLGEYE